MQKYICRLFILVFSSLGAVGSIISLEIVQAERDINVVPMPAVIDHFYLSPYVDSDQTGMSIEWQTGGEVGISGYYIWRSTTQAFEDAVRIGPFFEAKGDGRPDGVAQYAYLDSPFYYDVCYAYWLQEMQESDETVFHGPINYPVISTGVTPCRKLRENYPVYLPIINNR